METFLRMLSRELHLTVIGEVSLQEGKGILILL
jgi:hypothetical protein